MDLTGEGKNGGRVSKNSPSVQFFTRLERLSSGPGPLFLLGRLHGAGQRVLLHGREGVDGGEEGGDFGVGGQFGAVGA